MNQWIALLVMMLGTSFALADVPSEKAIIDQQNAQESCVQIRTKECLDKCDTTQVEDCEKLCDDFSKNECKWAGE